MPPPTDHPSPFASATRPAGARDPLVDGLRVVALGRVVLWHTFAAPWLSWIFPAMPVMFFLAGSVLAGSLLAGSATAGRGPVDHLRRTSRRVGRILIPFWAYSLGVLATMLIVGHRLDDAESGATGGWRLALSVVVPLHATSGTDRDWLTGHLWYLTDYLFLLVLLPIAVLLARRITAVVTVALLGLIALEVGPLLDLPGLTGAARVGVGDLLCYGLFALLGIAWAGRRGVPPTARTSTARAAGGTALIAATLVAGRSFPLPTGSLNESYLLLAVSALGWLLLIGAAEQPLRRLAGRPGIATTTRAVSARALTIYLWHPAAILLALTVAPDGPMAAPVTLGLTVLLTGTAVVALGWVEDLAAHRPPRLWPGVRSVRSRTNARRIALGTAATATAASVIAVAAIGVSGLVDDRTGRVIASIPRPSDRTALADSAFMAMTRDTAVTAADPAELPADDLQAALELWIATQPEVSDAVVSVASGTRTWSGNGFHPDGEPPAAESSVGMASLTKTFTAALAVQLAVEGLIDLDAPVPDLPGVDPLPDGAAITARQLLQHATGLVQYTDAPGYDPAQVYTAAELVSLSTRAPLAHPPDTAVTYSNSNYLWLGLLLEAATTSDYATLLHERITSPLDLRTVGLAPDGRPGWVGSASGGVTATPADTARFFDALLNQGAVVPLEGLQRMIDLDHLNGGLGVWPMCPCGEGPDGRRWATGLGHNVGDGAAFAFPDDRLAIYLRIGTTGDQISADRMIEMRDQLMVLMRETARRIDDVGN
ncbi:MAG TPA: serine hydrolase [Nakamurella sp.]